MPSDEGQDNPAPGQYDEKPKHANQPKQPLEEHRKDLLHDGSAPYTHVKYEKHKVDHRSLNYGNSRGRKLRKSHESHERSPSLASAYYRRVEGSNEVGPSSHKSHASVAVHDFAIKNARTRSDQDGITTNREELNTDTAILNTSEPDSKNFVSRAPTFAHHTIAKSTAEGNFIHHRDTFALVKKRPKHQIQSKILSRPIVFNILQFVDHENYLSMRLLSRSWNKVVDSVKPPHFPAVYRLPSESILKIYIHLLGCGGSSTSPAFAPVKDFNNARHTCRAWMAASLDKRLLAWTFLRMGRWNSLCRNIPELMDQNETRDDDPDILWRMSLLLAKECKQDGKSVSLSDHNIFIDKQLDGASDSNSTIINNAQQ